MNYATPKPRLTPKQEGFVRWYCSAEVRMNGAEAARRAGYRGNNATLRAIASQNLTKLNVRQQIDERIESALSGAAVTVEKVLRDLERTYIKALADGQYSPAVKCLELQGKYLKMFTDKIEHVQQNLEEVSTEELVQLLREISGSGGIDLRQLFDQTESGHTERIHSTDCSLPI